MQGGKVALKENLIFWQEEGEKQAGSVRKVFIFSLATWQNFSRHEMNIVVVNEMSHSVGGI